eukprot:TRINITY_DN7035_c0_g1_i1.p1 TRINITY_DN7035_c0_g1~~TRINITY_DN7035_c0_g1_i1.p1  ORF type:complete len:509 (+),score=110.40 TRINITY_DN7035_c0_g1_i1:37-1563(+)
MWRGAFRRASSRFFKSGAKGQRFFSQGGSSGSSSGKASWASAGRVGVGAVGIGAFVLASLPVSTGMSPDQEKDKQATDAAAFQSLLNKAHGQRKGEVPVYRIVLTGGPCGGKSTALAHISDRLSSLGFRVFRVPEAATILITAIGVIPPLMNPIERSTFEGVVVKTKIALEDSFYSLAKSSGRPSVIICDRGTMDTAAYMSEEDWAAMLDEHNWNVVDLRDKRYDAVVHMVTAAIGAEKYYTTENNAARHENIEEARALDFKILNAWIGHPRVRIIDNSTDFPSKLNRAVAIISQMIGAPRPSHSIRKFIISNSDPDSIIKKLPLHVETFEIEQTYLMRAQDDDDSSSGYNYLRRRGQQGIYTYTLSAIREPGREFKKSVSSRGDAARDEEQIVLERALSGREYVSLLQQRDTSRIVVKKKVHSFVWNNVYYELQTFQEPDLGLSILNCELEPELTPQLPTFFDVEQEVTGAKEFSSYYISKRFKEIKRRWTEDEILKSVAAGKPKSK